MELTWSLDYCLACDKQTAGETYCSQSCRLADLEASSTWSGSTSPTTPGPSPSWPSYDPSRGSGFYLPPAINFATYKAPVMPSSSPSNQTKHPQTSYFSSTASNQISPSRNLTPSSSHSSLSSTGSDSSQPSLSEQARTELRAYTNAFDDSRNWRRRKTWS